MHTLDISTNVYHHPKRKRRRSVKTIMTDIFSDITRNVNLQNGCHLEYSGFYTDRETKRVHLIVQIESNDPVIIADVCGIIEGVLHLPRKALIFIN